MIRMASWRTAIRVMILLGLLISGILYSETVYIQRIPKRIQVMAFSGDPSLAKYLDNQMVSIPAGSFLMGSDTARLDEKPAHFVYVDTFELDQFEITNIQYRRFVLEREITPPRYWEGSIFPDGQDIFPVLGVRWKDAEAYCIWAGKRLPTEAEWEKACRGEKGNIYPWGNKPDTEVVNIGLLPGRPRPGMWDDAWLNLGKSHENNIPAPKEVGSFPAGISHYGIFDLIGNASEWTADYYNWDGYWDVPSMNPMVTEPAWNHVIRGSSWMMPYGTSMDGFDLNRCSARSSSHGDTRDVRIGFRCARSINH